MDTLNEYALKYVAFISVFVLITSAVLSCRKEKSPIWLSGKYKFMYSFEMCDPEKHEFCEDGHDTVFVVPPVMMLDMYADFVDSGRVLMSSQIGFPGTYPVVSSKYHWSGSTLYVDESDFSPFHVIYSHADGSTILTGNTGISNCYVK